MGRRRAWRMSVFRLDWLDERDMEQRGAVDQLVGVHCDNDCDNDVHNNEYGGCGGYCYRVCSAGAGAADRCGVGVDF